MTHVLKLTRRGKEAWFAQCSCATWERLGATERLARDAHARHLEIHANGGLLD